MSLFHISLIYQRLDNTVTAAAAGVTQHSGDTGGSSVSTTQRCVFSRSEYHTQRSYENETPGVRDKDVQGIERIIYVVRLKMTVVYKNCCCGRKLLL